MGLQLSPPPIRRKLSSIALAFLALYSVGTNSVISAQHLPLPVQDIRTRTSSRLSLQNDGFLLQDPSASYYDRTSIHGVSLESEQSQDQEHRRYQLEELCKHLLEPSEEQDLLAEPRLIGESNAPENSTWRLWYREPAEEVEKEGFLIGNGRSQVLVGGAINVERLILSEESCWTGGPDSVSKSTFSHSEDGFEYRGGNVAESEARKQQEALQEFRSALKEQRVIRLSTPIVKTLQGDERGFGRPEAFGEVQIEEVHAFEKVENYRRELNLALGVVRVSFTVRGVEYTREHFCSNPDSICVMRITASQPKSISIKVSLKSYHDQNLEYTNIHNRLGLRAHLASNNMTIGAQVAVKPEGATGVSMSNSRQVIALGFDTVTLYYSIGTGWTSNSFPKFEDKDPHDQLVSAVDKAITMFYVDQYDKHVKDHQGLFQGFELDLGELNNTTPTDELLEAVHDHEAGDEEAYLEALMVQYGRYLLIASSRSGSLPASGRTVWSTNDGLADDSPSNGYKMNIDLQMTYWLAEGTGLGETVKPLIEYMENLLVPRGEHTATLHHGVRGWTTYTFSNIWAHTGPTSQHESFYFPAANAWLCQHAWDRYLYSQDYYFLRDHGYKLMKGAAQFWLDSLVRDHDNTTFLTSPAYSPEHGPFTEGTALDQQLIWQLFNNTLAAIAVVGERDKVFVQNLTSTLENLSPGLKIGNVGQLQEWNLDFDDPNEAHRHLAPFWAVYPGQQIFLPQNGSTGPSREELLEAAQRTLDDRGMGKTQGNLGWPKSWRAVLWARLGNGTKAYKALHLFKKYNIKHPNLLDFEEGLSGQLGLGTAIVEMIIQSQMPGQVDVLTNADSGLPERWLKAGSVQGFRTRDGHNITAVWEEAKVRSVEITATLKVADVRVRIGTLRGDKTPSEKVHVFIKGSSKPAVFTREEDTIVLTMAKGQTYLIAIDP
ncbi:MAG: Six-hairpin glycosidase-like protein [Benniella sp.]|nr:MAG: Six-hairpin glycosidase-like protein [Benniella sp.]